MTVLIDFASLPCLPIIFPISPSATFTSKTIDFSPSISLISTVSLLSTKFIMINSKVPVNEQLARQEKKIYLEGAYDALRLCDEKYAREEILIEDDSADHYPIDIEYNVGLEVVNNTEQLVRVWEDQRKAYGVITNAILDNLSEEYIDSNIKEYVLKTKDESQIAIQSLSEEIKTMISQFKADIDPNIDRIQKNIENISNRGNEIQKEIQNTKLPFLKK